MASVYEKAEGIRNGDFIYDERIDVEKVTLVGSDHVLVEGRHAGTHRPKSASYDVGERVFVHRIHHKV